MTLRSSFYLMLFLLCVVCAPSAHTADLFSVPTDAELGMTTFDRCSTSLEASRYDCRCLALRMVDLKKNLLRPLIDAGLDQNEQEYEWQKNIDRLRDQAHSTCYDQNKVAVRSFNQCRDLFIVARPDYENYCTCYATTYLDSLKRQGENRLTPRSRLMADAMITCNNKFPNR